MISYDFSMILQWFYQETINNYLIFQDTSANNSVHEDSVLTAAHTWTFHDSPSDGAAQRTAELPERAAHSFESRFCSCHIENRQPQQVNILSSRVPLQSNSCSTKDELSWFGDTQHSKETNQCLPGCCHSMLDMGQKRHAHAQKIKIINKND